MQTAIAIMERDENEGEYSFIENSSTRREVVALMDFIVRYSKKENRKKPDFPKKLVEAMWLATLINMDDCIPNYVQTFFYDVIFIFIGNLTEEEAMQAGGLRHLHLSHDGEIDVWDFFDDCYVKKVSNGIPHDNLDDAFEAFKKEFDKMIWHAQLFNQMPTK